MARAGRRPGGGDAEVSGVVSTLEWCGKLISVKLAAQRSKAMAMIGMVRRRMRRRPIRSMR